MLPAWPKKVLGELGSVGGCRIAAEAVSGSTVFMIAGFLAGPVRCYYSGRIAVLRDPLTTTARFYCRCFWSGVAIRITDALRKISYDGMRPGYGDCMPRSVFNRRVTLPMFLLQLPLAWRFNLLYCCQQISFNTTQQPHFAAHGNCSLLVTQRQHQKLSTKLQLLRHQTFLAVIKGMIPIGMKS